MNRPALITLRVLAIGSALTVLGCLVANNQKNANASAQGDRGQPGPVAPGTQTAGDEPRPATWASSSKSLSGPVFSTRNPGSGAGQAQVQQNAPQQPANEPPRRFMGGSKSAAVVSPRDLAGHQSAPAVGVDRKKNQEAAARHLSRGNGFYDLGHYADASAEFSAALALDPDNMAAKTGLEKTKKALSAPPVDPKYFQPGSKSAGVVRPSDVRQMRQGTGQAVNPPAAQQTAPNQ